MHLISVLLIAVAANVDNLAVAIAYGIKRLRIRLLTNLFIALVSGISTYLSISVGEDIAGYLSVQLANLLGSLVLLGLGIWGVWTSIKQERKRTRKRAKLQQTNRILVAAGLYPIASEQTASHANLSAEGAQEFLQEFSYETFLENPEKADHDQSGYIDVRESIALAFGLALNNLGAGIGGGISGLSGVTTTAAVVILSLMSISGGYILGVRFSTRMPGVWAGILSGGLLAITGVYEYFVLP